MQRLTAAWKKNEELEAQLREARKRADKGAEEPPWSARIRHSTSCASTRVNLQLSGRCGSNAAT